MALLVSIPAHAGQCNPIDESSDEYSVEICFEAPLGDAEVVGDAEVSISVTVRGTDPGIRRVVFYLSDEYMLTDFSAPYSFTLPSEYWIDGEYLLEAEALLRDNTTTSRAGIRVEFANGVLSTPVNTGAFTPALGSDAGPGASFVVAATGDGPDGGPNAEAVVSRIERVGANMLLFLGDVYEKGSRTEFFNWYGSDGANWDALRPITNPTLGNHETSGGVAIGYDEYWDNVPRYYSFDAQGWHFVSLDSNALKRDDPDQVAWLQDDLSANTASCTIAFYHHPVLTVGPQGDSPELNDVWADLVDNGVDIVLGGHDHSYQRWTPLDRNLQPDDAGATQFVVGAGGHGIQIFSREDARMVTGADSSPNAYGALFLTLNIDGAEYSYVNIAGDVRDAGIIPCRGTGSDTLAPSVPANLTASSVSSAHIDLSWDASSDNVGVAGYTIYRDGSILDTVSIGVTSYTDSTPEPDTSYVYAVGALDASGNTSTRSTQAIITTLVTPSEVVAVASEDAYVSAENPSTNHGSQTFLRVDGSPTRRAYVRFDVSGVVSPVTSTVLRIYAESASTGGFEVRALTGAGWNESTLTLDNAPVPGSIVAASGPLAPNTYVEIDISGYVEGGGSIDFVLTPLSDSGLRLSSRESPHPPQLVMSHNTTATTSPDGKADEAAPRAIDDASGPAWRWILVAIVVIAAIPIVIRRSSRHREN
jgi:chitodextrinase